MNKNVKKKSKFDKGLLALLLAPEIVLLAAFIVSGLIYFFSH